MMQEFGDLSTNLLQAGPGWDILLAASGDSTLTASYQREVSDRIGRQATQEAKSISVCAPPPRAGCRRFFVPQLPVEAYWMFAGSAASRQTPSHSAGGRMYLNKRRGNRSRKEERPPQIPGLPGHSEK